jgi:RNA polymerase sigma-70 factor (ECF subfamily)
MLRNMNAPGTPQTESSCSDARLIERAERGDREAGNVLALRYRQSVYLLALQLTRNPDDALDIAQEALFRFFRTLARFDRRRPVQPWLAQIVRNLVRDRGRRRKVRQEENAKPSSPDVIIEPRDKGLDPEARAVRREQQEMLWRLVGELPPRFREILVLRDYQGLSYQEMSDLLGVPMGTIMSRLHKARTLLREAWQGDTEEEA